ncbi:hypothetical protein, variant [Exophiala dermatitidis NIH/UT8656]|uniref:Uncharacterized protein n=1 Tax=Exophiala dermatitidis (strain ATCC 34100 / CBS 525.76 / NIH/UT8656) TaxID=858893 RepID=H6BN63_EXODN|nr:uncharacterized protein HMPREF1120_00403 [Exophiala dermatitidis NIH/UT8656]XP_009152649.1 hypothetical protein, variant [Exophiala dermatitidis NIH/UT8656]EHY52187.1 hypothetical protein, variant [Exophiala dermatitidis NIH/UT8656]EHY52188.1 hypothetical protein HMPREF1120_00403 [Exophiala dermatitidis NIH/UT8656]
MWVSFVNDWRAESKRQTKGVVSEAQSHSKTRGKKDNHHSSQRNLVRMHRNKKPRCRISSPTSNWSDAENRTRRNRIALFGKDDRGRVTWLCCHHFVGIYRSGIRQSAVNSARLMTGDSLVPLYQCGHALKRGP